MSSPDCFPNNYSLSGTKCIVLSFIIQRKKWSAKARYNKHGANILSECSCIQWSSSAQYRLTFLETENQQLKDRLVDVTNQANRETHKANVRINENKAEINENQAEINQAYNRVSNVLSQLVQLLQGKS